MGLVRKLDVDSVATGGDRFDTSTMIRQAVTAEIERQRLEKLKADEERAVDLPGDED